MRLAADPATARWLEGLAGAPSDFDWDHGNVEKNRKHQVTREQIEMLLRRPFVFAGTITEPAHSELRWLLLGEDDQGRKFALTFTRRRDRIRPISCRPMRRGERDVYKSAISSEDED